MRRNLLTQSSRNLWLARSSGVESVLGLPSSFGGYYTGIRGMLVFYALRGLAAVVPVKYFPNLIGGQNTRVGITFLQFDLLSAVGFLRGVLVCVILVVCVCFAYYLLRVVGSWGYFFFSGALYFWSFIGVVIGSVYAWGLGVGLIGLYCFVYVPVYAVYCVGSFVRVSCGAVILLWCGVVAVTLFMFRYTYAGQPFGVAARRDAVTWLLCSVLLLGGLGYAGSGLALLTTLASLRSRYLRAAYANAPGAYQPLLMLRSRVGAGSAGVSTSGLTFDLMSLRARSGVSFDAITQMGHFRGLYLCTSAIAALGGGSARAVFAPTTGTHLGFGWGVDSLYAVSAFQRITTVNFVSAYTLRGGQLGAYGCLSANFYLNSGWLGELTSAKVALRSYSFIADTLQANSTPTAVGTSQYIRGVYASELAIANAGLPVSGAYSCIPVYALPLRATSVVDCGERARGTNTLHFYTTSQTIFYGSQSSSSGNTGGALPLVLLSLLA